MDRRTLTTYRNRQQSEHYRIVPKGKKGGCARSASSTIVAARGVCADVCFTMGILDCGGDGRPTSLLLRLPFEVRLMIYEYLLFPSTDPGTGSGTSVANLMTDFHTYYSEDTNDDPLTLSVRTIDPWLGARTSRTWRRRSTYHVRTGKFVD